MSTTAENMMALTGRVSPEQVRDALMVEKVKAALYGTTHDIDMDDTGEWAREHRTTLQVGLADARLAKLADEENARVLAESVEHFAGCRGSSCRQGRLPCREACIPEMACTAGDDPPSYFTPFGKLAIAALLTVLVLGRWLAPLAG